MEPKGGRKGIRCTVTSCTPRDNVLEKISEKDEDVTDNTIKSESPSTDFPEEEDYVLMQKIKQQNQLLTDLTSRCEEIFNFSSDGSDSASESYLNSEPLSIKDRIRNFEQTFETTHQSVNNNNNSTLNNEDKLTDKVCADEDLGLSDSEPPTLDEDVPTTTNSDVDEFEVPNLIEKLEDIVRRNYANAKELFARREQEYMTQLKSFEVFHKMGKVGRSVFNNKDFFVMYQSLVTEMEKNSKMCTVSLDELPKRSKIAMDLSTSAHDASEFASVSASKSRKFLRKTTPQISDTASLKQFLTPEGLEQMANKNKKSKFATNSDGSAIMRPDDELKVHPDGKREQQEKELKVTQEEQVDAMRTPLPAPALSESSLLKVVGEVDLFNSPSDSRLLKCSSAAFPEDYYEDKILRDDLHYGNPFRAVFRRAALMDIHQLYNFISFPFADDELEESAKPVTTDYMEALMSSINNLCEKQNKLRRESIKVIETIYDTMLNSNDKDFAIESETSNETISVGN